LIVRNASGLLSKFPLPSEPERHASGRTLNENAFHPPAGMLQLPDRRTPLSPAIARLGGSRRRHQEGGRHKGDKKSGFQWCQYHRVNVPVFVPVAESIKETLTKN
ncbi:hypothetical protein, partial [Mesorhizobium sp. M2D.F.Ca.ET.223.01.1.1]|uniref:hypothetical protein n=1 Tax=Mesorhizobium sp. M2D.F.Ca.ET.223.01.1.1 TaxID=2563940 RepID=UPI001AED5041